MHKSAEETLSHRPSGLSRRGAMGASLATIAAVTGGASLAGGPRTALAQSAPAPAATPARPAGPQPFDFPGKERGLKLLGDRPLVAETPEALLDDDTTPIAKFFIRNNGQIPAEITDRDGWRFTV